MINKRRDIVQLSICFSYIFVFWNLALLSKYTIKEDMVDICIKTVLIDSIFAILCFFSIKYYREKISMKSILKKVKENKFLILGILMFIISLFSILDIWLMGDGAIYYSQVLINREWNFKNIFNLKLAGHQTSLYTIWLLIGEYIIPNNAIGVRMVVILLASVTVAMYYEILKKIYENCNKLNIALFVLLFALHPAFWGILGEINTDLPILIFLTWVIYFQINRLYILSFFSAIMLCFSKETGVLVFAFYVLGCVGYKVVCGLGKGWKESLKQMFSVEMISLYGAGIIWAIIWLVCSRGMTWTGGSESLTDNTDGISGIKLDTFHGCIEYMNHKLKEIFVLNYGYIFWIFAILAILFFFFTNKKLHVKSGFGYIIIGLYFSFVGFLNFNLYFVTWPNYRYIISVVLFETFFASIFVFGYIENVRIQRIVIVCVLILVFISNFRADPISKQVFNKVSMGNGDMISTNLFYIENLDSKILGKNKTISYEYAYDDEGVYNREYSYRGKCINEILKKIKYNSKTLIIFPHIVGSKSFYYGRSEWYESEKIYVNKKTYKLSINYLDQDMSKNGKWIEFNDIYLNPEEKISEEILESFERVYYVYPLLSGKNKINYKEQLNGHAYKKRFDITKGTTGFRVLKIK